MCFVYARRILHILQTLKILGVVYWVKPSWSSILNIVRNLLRYFEFDHSMLTKSIFPAISFPLIRDKFLLSAKIWSKFYIRGADAQWDSPLTQSTQYYCTFSLLWVTLQRHNNENSKRKFTEKELRGLIPNLHIHVFESDIYIYIYIPQSVFLFGCRKICWTDPGNI